MSQRRVISAKNPELLCPALSVLLSNLSLFYLTLFLINHARLFGIVRNILIEVQLNIKVKIQRPFFVKIRIPYRFLYSRTAPRQTAHNRFVRLSEGGAEN